MSFTDDYSLVLLATVLCWLTSIGTVSLAGQAHVAAGDTRRAWNLVAAAATAIGVWTAHLAVTAAFVSAVPIAYDPGLTAGSLVVGCALAIAALHLAVDGHAPHRAAIGGALVGVSVALVHDLNLWALEPPASVTWSAGLAVLAAVPAALAGAASFMIVADRDDWRARLAAGSLLGLGMAAALFLTVPAITIIPDSARTVASFSVRHASMAFAAGGVAVTMLVMILIGARVDRSTSRKLREQNQLLQDALSHMSQGLCMFNAEGRLVLWNQSYVDMYSLHGRLKAGLTLHDILRQRLEVGTLSENPDDYVQRVNAAAAARQQFRHMFDLADGRKISVCNEARAGGGWVSTHEDVTEWKRRAASSRLLFEANPVPMWVYDLATLRFVAVNDAAVEHYGYSRKEFLTMSILDIRPAEERETARELARAPDQRSAQKTWTHVKADGMQIEVAVFSRALMFEGRPSGFCAIVDLTDRKHAEDEIRRTRTFLNTIIEHVPSNIIVKELPSFRYLLVNQAGERQFDLPREAMIGKTAAEIFPQETAEFIERNDRELLESGRESFCEEHTIITPTREPRLVRTTRLPVLGLDGRPQYMITLIEDMTQRRRYEAKIAYMAHHDALTDLPNRAAFNECMDSILAKASEEKQSFAVLSVDLDRLKEVNDVFGHPAGDEFLRLLAVRLKDACDGAFLARLDGDEFVAVSACGPQPATGEALAQRLQAAAAHGVEIDGHQLQAGLTIGVSIYPTDGTDAVSLAASADAAMYRAKSEARGTIRFFEPDMDKRLREKRALHQDLRQAIVRGNMELHYQPLAQINGRITGFEALLRWHHPTRGLVPPATFIPLAEESGLIAALGEWALREACREAASWPKPLRIAVNLSPVQFQHGDLAALVHTILLETGLAPARLELEVTEGVLIGDFAHAVSILRRFKNLGVRIAMDDFGTGYSSLSYLQSFPFDKIKIDRTFISQLDSNPQATAITRAVIGLGHGLDLPVVAEGVETRAQLQFLEREACEEVQGYLIGRPAPIEAYAQEVGRPAVKETTKLAG